MDISINNHRAEFIKAVKEKEKRIKRLNDQLSDVLKKIDKLEREKKHNVSFERFEIVNDELKRLNNKSDHLKRQINQLTKGGFKHE